MWVKQSDGGRLWIEEYERPEFFTERWHFQAGQHITILGPTGTGKTTLVSTLLEYSTGPKLPVINFALKPRDKVMSAECKRQGWKIVRDWPPLVLGHPNGWTLWPKHSADPDADDARMAPIVRKALMWAYGNAAKQGRDGLIINADEMEEIQRLLAVIHRAGMLRGLYRRIRSNGGTVLAGCQAPKFLVTDAYSQAEHLLLANDPEKRNRDRFGEIGGMYDSKIIERAVLQLPPFHWLYLRRTGRVMGIVGP